MSIQPYTDPWPHSKVVPFYSFQTESVHMKQGTKHLWSPHCSHGNPLLSIETSSSSSSSQLCICVSPCTLLPSSVPCVRARQTADSLSQRPPPWQYTQSKHDFKGCCLWAFHWVCFWGNSSLFCFCHFNSMFPPQKHCTEIFYSKPAEQSSGYSYVDVMGKVR